MIRIVNESSEPLHTPLTVEAVAKRMDELCNAHVAAANRIKADFKAEINELAETVEASLELDKQAVAVVVLARTNKMITELQAAYRQ